MRIVVLGGGAIGSYLAARLSEEGQDVVLVEADTDRASELQDTLDALVLTGNGASPKLLREAGVHKSDLLIAVTSSDGANALACHTAHELGDVRTVARIEDPELRPGLEEMGVDVVIDPGRAAAAELRRLIAASGAFDVVEFADGQLVLLGEIVHEDSPIIGQTMADLRARHADVPWSAMIVRDGKVIPTRGETEVAAHDHVMLTTPREHVSFASSLLGTPGHDVRRVIVLGATRLAELAADELISAGHEVVLIDDDEDRTLGLAERHPKALVLRGDPIDPRVLSDLSLGLDDAVVALSGWDEVNLAGCMLAKSLGAGTVIPRFARLSWIPLLLEANIDAAISSRLAAANAILRFVRRGRIHAVSTFKDTDAEAIEIEVGVGSAADGAVLAELDLPRPAVVAGVHRGADAFVPNGQTELKAGDGLIILTPVAELERIERMVAPPARG